MSIGIEWVGGYSGNWGDENNWDPPMVPSGNDIAVTFPGKFSGVYIIVIDQNVTINSLSIYGETTNLEIASPFSLTITNSLTLGSYGGSPVYSGFGGPVQIADGFTISGDSQCGVSFSSLSSIAGSPSTATYTADTLESLHITSMQLCGSLLVTNVANKYIAQSTAIVCGSSCCTSTQTCVNGTCCASDSVCGSSCCSSSQTCVNGICVNPNSVCGSICCTSSQTCINGICCASESVCSSNCCSSTQTCLNGTCVNPGSACGAYTCSAGESCCGNTTCCLATQTCCGKYCCYPNEACCNGICCNPGQTCNVDNICVDG